MDTNAWLRAERRLFETRYRLCETAQSHPQMRDRNRSLSTDSTRDEDFAEALCAHPRRSRVPRTGDLWIGRRVSRAYDETEMKQLKRAIFIWLFMSAAVHAAVRLPGPLVEPDWLLAHLADEDLVVLDVQEPEAFIRHHVPNSVNWPFSQWRTGADARPPSSLLPLEDIAERLGRNGITETKPLVIVATGVTPADLSASARVFWTLKVLGHEEVAILNGGLLSYVNEHRGPFVSGAGKAHAPETYRASPNLDLLATAEWLHQSDMPRLDARSLAEFTGVVAGPGERPGTLPGAHHLPYDWLTKDGGGRLRPRGELDRLFQYAGVRDRAAVHFCHTGNRAALSWFVDFALMGNREARLYDGSMIEWGKDPALPIETRLDPGREPQGMTK